MTYRKKYTARRMDGVLPQHSHVSAPRLVDLRAMHAARRANTAHLCHNGAWAQDFLSSAAAYNAVQRRAIDGIRPTQPIGVRHDDVASLRERLMERVVGMIATYRAALRISLSAQRMYQMSMAGAMIVGMLSMSMIYRNLGTSAFADTETGGDVTPAERSIAVAQVENENAAATATQPMPANAPEKSVTEQSMAAQGVPVKVIHNRAVDSIVAREVPSSSTEPQEKAQDVAKEEVTKTRFVDSVKKADALPQTPLTKEAQKMVKGYPIEKMLPYILKQDPEVAKYLIAIAKQESQWGKRVPKLNGEDCYNYWGYRGQRVRMGTGGHTCFDSPEDAVATVGKRLHTLIYDNKRTTAKMLVIWKCGTTCANHDPAGVHRWIDVVDAYHATLSKKS